MNAYKPLRIVILFYELIRFLNVIWGARFFSIVNDLSQTDNLMTLVWLAPNALFPLMALFLLFDLVSYKPYLPLYLTGKCVTLALTLRLGVGMLISPFDGSTPERSVIFLALGDAVCIISSVLALHSLKKIRKERSVPEESLTDNEES